MNKVREVKYYKRHALDFINAQKTKTIEKIEWTIRLIETVLRGISTCLKHIEEQMDYAK